MGGGQDDVGQDQEADRQQAASQPFTHEWRGRRRLGQRCRVLRWIEGKVIIELPDGSIVTTIPEMIRKPHV